MKSSNPDRRRSYRAKVVLLLLAGILVGCDAPEAQFRLDRAYAFKQEETVGEQFTQPQLQDIVNALTALFGTPDEPYFVNDTGAEDVVQMRRLEMAAGPVGRDEDGQMRGLFRQHCAHCHGVTGDGAGPTAAYLNPYPRDYRPGVFKFKSTPKGGRPTSDDLKRILVNGIPGTAMPSFRLLPDGELDALVDYVKYLSIRGEVERLLLEETADLDSQAGERLDTSRDNLVDDKLDRVVRRWKQAESQATHVPARPDLAQQESLERGRELYFGSIANCVKCHGDTQLGDGQTTDYDDWAKEFYDWGKPTDPAVRREKLNEYLALGGLPPRNIQPRDLRQGVYRGGRRPVDLYWRVLNGIDGSPMPAAMMKPEGAPADAKGLTPKDLWCLIEYVRSLPYEKLSETGMNRPSLVRERM